MILKQVRDQLANDTGNTDDNILLAWLNIAGVEIWNHADYPGTLREQQFQVSQNLYVSLPWFVQHIRAVKPCDKLPVEINTPRPAYFDETWYQSPWIWRVLKETPLHTSISNATPIKCTIGAVEDEDLTIYLAGKTGAAEEVQEELVIPAGSLHAHSVNGYEDMTNISKIVLTKTNVVVTDTEENEIAMIPNHIFDARNTIVQVRDRQYAYNICTTCNCIDVLYKPMFQGWTSFSAVIPQDMYLPLLYKAMEVSTMRDVKDPVAWNQKAAITYTDMANNYTAGKSLRFQYRRNPFSAHFGGHL